jgi:hypothetical protein
MLMRSVGVRGSCSFPLIAPPSPCTLTTLGLGACFCFVCGSNIWSLLSFMFLGEWGRACDCWTRHSHGNKLSKVNKKYTIQHYNSIKSTTFLLDTYLVLCSLNCFFGYLHVQVWSQNTKQVNMLDKNMSNTIEYTLEVLPDGIGWKLARGLPINPI